jgi:NADH-quinone oxidoreductase subunit D
MSLTEHDLTHVTDIDSDEQTIETSLEELRGLVSERAFTGETMLLNMGPQHPSTHGVLRFVLELDGESIVNIVPDIGFLHTGIEKTMESKSFLKSMVMADRKDYFNPLGNNFAYCLAVEKLVDVDVPERAQIIRVLLAELSRINSHLLWQGTHALDLAAMSVFLYCLREREYVLDIFELVSGQRMMTSYIRPGGVWRDVPSEFDSVVSDFLDYFPAKIDDYEALLKNNPLWLERTKDIGLISPDDAIAWGLTGPSLRGSGVNWDIRKAHPYSGYETYDFDVPLGEDGDVYSRYWIRVEEMRQSLRIVRQALGRLKKTRGPVITEDRKIAPPPRSELGRSMEAVIHHFKLWTEGFNAPKGEVYLRIESPRGELGVFLAGNGGPTPHRVRFRTPSFVHVQALPVLAKGHMVADLVAIIGSIDPTAGDSDR